MLFKREDSLGGTWEHMGSVRPEVYEPQVIRTTLNGCTPRYLGSSPGLDPGSNIEVTTCTMAGTQAVLAVFKCIITA